MLLDQDSEPLETMLDGFRTAYTDFSPPERLGLIGSRFELPGIPTHELPQRLRDVRPKATSSATPRYAERETVITSGSLLALAVFRRVGRMREDFFIDAVDFEYCLRLRRYGYKVIETLLPTLIHPIGVPTVQRVFGRLIVTTNHSPLRRYYIVRNRLLLARAYFFSEFSWVMNSLWALVKETAIVLLAEKERGRKMAATLRGLAHGLANRRGPLATK